MVRYKNIKLRRRRKQNTNYFKELCLKERYKGYIIIRNAVNISMYTLSQMKQNTFYTIFNDNYNKNDDNNRLQASIQTQNSIFTQIKTCCNQYYPDLTMNDPVLIKSLPGCQEQIPHCDIDPSEIPLDLEQQSIPQSVIVATKSSKICVWPYSHLSVRDNIIKTKKRVIHMQQGDLLIFRSDLVHAGCSYNEENYRIHTYLDSKHVKRIHDTTYPIKYNFFA